MSVSASEVVIGDVADKFKPPCQRVHAVTVTVCQTGLSLSLDSSSAILYEKFHKIHLLSSKFLVLKFTIHVKLQWLGLLSCKILRLYLSHTKGRIINYLRSGGVASWGECLTHISAEITDVKRVVVVTIKRVVVLSN